MANGGIPLPRDDDFGLAPSARDIPPVPAFGASSVPFPPPELPGLEFVPDPVSFRFGGPPPLTQPGLDVVEPSAGLLGAPGPQVVPEPVAELAPAAAPPATLQGLVDPFAAVAPPPTVQVPEGVGEAIEPAGAVPDPLFGLGGLDVPAPLPTGLVTQPQREPTLLEQVQAPRPALIAATGRVAQLSDEQGRLRAANQQVVIDLGQATTDKQRNKLRQQFGENQAAQQVNQSQLDIARQAGDEERLVARQQQQDNLATLVTRRQLDARQELADQAVLDQGAQDRLLAEQDTARETHQQTLKEHEEIVAKGNPVGGFTAALAMISEALSAFNQRRPPNFNAALQPFIKANEAAHRRQVQASQLKVLRTGDNIKDIARQGAERRAQDAARDEVHLRSVQLNLDQIIATEQDRDRREAAEFVRDDVRRQADARGQEAAAFRAKLARQQASQELKDNATRAGIAKTEAQASKLRAETTKLTRSGGGSGRKRREKALVLNTFPPDLRELAASGPEGKREARRIFPLLIIDPSSGKSARRADKSLVLGTSPAVARELNQNGAGVNDINDLVNEAIALRGKEGWEPTGAWLGTKAGRRMSALNATLTVLNKETFSLGVLTGDDIKILDAIQGGDLAGLKDPRPQLQDMVRRMTKAYNSRLRVGAPGARPIAFRKVIAAPRASARNLRIALTQSPDLETGASEPATSRLEKTDELFDVLIEEKQGNIRKASEAFTSQVDVITKQSDDHLATINDAIGAERTPDLVGLERDVVKAGRDLFLLGTTASGQQVNEARARLDQARIDLSNAQSPKLKSLINQRNEQSNFIVGLKSKSAGQLQRQREAAQREAERERALEQPFTPELFEGQ